MTPAGRGAARLGLALLLGGAGLALAASAAGGGELREAARRGDLARVVALLRGGADVNATSASGDSALVAAARAGSLEVARRLLAAGAAVDARHRELGTALDVAERDGHAELAALLRAHGARGSGQSPGDGVCSRLWGGSGWCGTVTERRAQRFRVRVRSLPGCDGGCAPDPECSAGRPLGGRAALAVRPGGELVVPSWCLTDTAVLEPGR